MAPYTPQSEVLSSLLTLRATFNTNKTKSLAWRKWQLKQCWWMVADNESRFIDAAKTDLNRHPFETQMMDLTGVKADVLDQIENLENWTADEIPPAGLFFRKLGGARIKKEPLGVVLILGTWNFPLATALQPVFGAIAAGCCVMLRPSEMPVATQELLEELFPKYLDQSAIRLVTGGPQETSFILEQRFDHIFFTGSPNTGKIIAQAAAKHLTPTTLELGGQNPTIVFKSANVDLAAKRIMYSKLSNAGQICLSANHVFVDPAVYDTLIEKLVYWTDQMYKGLEDQMPHLISQKHAKRLQDMLDKTKGKVVYRSKVDVEMKAFGPTIVTNLDMDGAFDTGPNSLWFTDVDL